MEIDKKNILRKIEDGKDVVSYLKDIDIGIPPGEIEQIDFTLQEAENLVRNDNSTIAGNKLNSIDGLFAGVRKNYFSNLSPRKIDSISRSDQRPRTLDYAREVFEDFEEIKGIDANSADPSVVCGFARLDNNNIMVIGHEKGGFNEDYRRGGSALPQGNLKAIRAMKIAEKFGIPVVTFIDTPGSWPLE